MKIAFLNKQLPSDQPNGVSIQVHRLANAMVRLGHEVTCFSFSPAPLDSSYKTHIFEWGKKSRLILKFIPALKFRSVDCKDFEIIHYHGDDYLCRKTRKRVRTFYGSALQEALHAGSIGRFFYQALFYFFEWISCLKQGKIVGISKNTIRSLPLIKTNIPCGIPLELYNPGNVSKTAYPSILFIGGIKGRKRGSVMVNLFQQNILPLYPDCILTIIGPQVYEGRNIIYIPCLPENELIEQYRSNWIYCQTSSYEGFGVPVLEAMACGTAVVATKNPGAKEIISDGVDGYCCNISDLGKYITALINSEELRYRFYRNGLLTANKYGIENTALLYEKIYKSICSGFSSKMNHCSECNI